MKKILITALFIIAMAGSALAQADSLVINEDNKLIYYQVVVQPGTAADTLYNKAVTFLKNAYSKDRLKAGNINKAAGTLTAVGGVLVSKKAMIAMHEDASIGFNLTIEIKAGRYRYWFTDFVVTTYMRDRYANYVPAPGKSYPLEEGKGKLSAEDYNGYMKKVLANCQEVGTVLKSYMQNKVTSKVAGDKKAVVPKEW